MSILPVAVRVPYNAAGFYSNPINMQIDNNGDIVSAVNGIASTGAGITTPSGWNTALLSKLSTANSTRVNITVFGDSIAAGSYASNQIPSQNGTCWTAKLQSQLQALYGDGGSGFVQVAQSPLFTNNSIYSSGQVPVNVVGSSWAYSTNAFACPSGGFLGSTTIGETMTVYARGSSVSIFAFRDSNPAALFSAMFVTIDGGTSTLIPLTSGPTASVNCAEYVFSGLSAGDHSVVIQNHVDPANMSNNNINIIGVAGYNPTGVVVHNCSIPGYSLSGLISAGSSVYNGVFAQTGGLTFPTLQADLLILALGANDNGVAAATTLTNFITEITAYRNQLGLNYSNQSIMVLQENYGLFDNANLTQFRENTSSLANSYNYANVDLNVLIGQNSYQYSLFNLGFWSGGSNGGSTAPTSTGASGTTLANSNGIHPSNTGHALIAALLLSVITRAI